MMGHHNMALRKLFSDIRQILRRATSWTTSVVSEPANTIMIHTPQNPNVVSELREVSAVPRPVVSVEVGPHESWSSPEMKRHVAKCHAIFAKSPLFTKAIQEYTSAGYHVFNGALRGGSKLNRNELWWVKSIHAMFHNVPPLPSDTYVYRGVGLDGKHALIIGGGLRTGQLFLNHPRTKCNKSHID
jgi:hypothetical protein